MLSPTNPGILHEFTWGILIFRVKIIILWIFAVLSPDEKLGKKAERRWLADDDDTIAISIFIPGRAHKRWPSGVSAIHASRFSLFPCVFGEKQRERERESERSPLFRFLEKKDMVTVNYSCALNKNMKRFDQ